MAVSGLSTFDISGGNIILFSYALCGLRRTALLPQHMEDARIALNMLFSAWGNDTPNLWTVDLISQPLTAETATYSVAADTIMILDAYIRTGDDPPIDRLIWPISRTEYAAQANKTLQGYPTSFWFDRQLAPTITLWPVPDDQQDYTLQYYRCTVIQDALVPNGVTLDIPRWWQLAAAYGLAELLSDSYAPQRTQRIAGKAQELWVQAKEQDTENVGLFVIPALSGYFQR